MDATTSCAICMRKSWLKGDCVEIAKQRNNNPRAWPTSTVDAAAAPDQPNRAHNDPLRWRAESMSFLGLSPPPGTGRPVESRSTQSARRNHAAVVSGHIAAKVQVCRWL